MNRIDPRSVRCTFLMAEVGPFKFFEDPDQGDEAPLIMKDTEDGHWYATDFWEVPTLEEIYDELTQF